jgi:diguanylate cyclase (GGDEF)-like protein/PAS domain S-box-containing protein
MDGGAHQPPDPGLTPQLLQLLRRVPVALYIGEIGPTAPWLYVSPQIEELLGYTPDEWCRDPELWSARLHPADRERMLSEEAAASAGRGDPTQSEYRLVHRDGHTVWVADEATIVETPGGPRWHGVLTDISEYRHVRAELERRAEQQAAVARLGEHALEGASPSALMQEALTAAAGILELEVAAVVAQRPGGYIEFRAGIGWPADSIGERRHAGGADSPTGYAILTGRAVVVRDWSTEQRFAHPEAGGFEARSSLAVPIEGRSGRYGALSLGSAQRRELSDGDLDFAQALANVLADALGRQASEDEVRHRSTHDSLTGLPNRVLFTERAEAALARAERHGTLVAVLFLDLDHFKLVNDSLGHHVGDQLLSDAAHRLRRAVRGIDTVARFGGDEFAVLLEDLGDQAAAIDVAERIGRGFAEPFRLSGQERVVTASIGIALSHGEDTPIELIRDADAAMYRGKEHGRARWELFDETMRAQVVSRVRIENDLRHALERDELALCYQPVVSVPDHRLVGVEALLRWHHPEHGSLPTRDFVSIAEDTGMIEAIGRWVLKVACRDAAGWTRGADGRPPVWVAVNVSPVQLRAPGLPEAVAAVLAATGLDPACLHLELTESVMIDRDPLVEQTLRALDAIGVRMVLDDFGTGYSSLSYLTHLPIRALKLDRSFVDGLGRDPRDTAIAEAITAMAHSLGLEVVGEGVEDVRQAAELARLGCAYAQGFWFSPPVEPPTIAGLLGSGQTNALLPGRSGDTVTVPHS